MNRSCVRKLQRQACKETAKRIKLDALVLQIQRPAQVQYDSDAGNSAGSDSDFAEGIVNPAVAANDIADNSVHPQERNDFPNGYAVVDCNTAGGDLDLNADNDLDVIEGNSIVSAQSDEVDAASEEEGRPNFRNDAEKEQFVIDTVREWAQEPGVLSMTKLDHLLHRLSIVFPGMPLSYKTLFACDYDFNFSEFASGGEFWYKGIRANLDQLSLGEYLSQFNIITLDIGIDGLPLTKNRPVKLWPILAHLVGTDNAPFIIAVFKGGKDPEDVNEYLAVYVAEVQDLLENGYTFKEKVYEFRIRNYILDAPARQFVKCIVGHTGYCACEKCEVFGEHVNNRLTFLDIDAPLRTDESFQQRDQLKHHRDEASPLERLGTGMVSQFRLDPMHLVYGGVVKRLMGFWLNTGWSP